MVRVAESMSESQGAGFLTTFGVGVGVGFFIQLRKSNWTIFYIALHVRNPISCLLKWYNFFWNFYLKQSQRILAVYHDFHWLLVSTKLLTAKLHSRYVEESESEILERSESDILPPTPQPWLWWPKTPFQS